MENVLRNVKKVELAQDTMNEQQNYIQSLLDMTNKVANTAGEVLERVEYIRQLSLTANSLSERGETRIDVVVRQMNQIHSRVESIVQRMQILSDYSQDILRILDVLKSIATNTKILSLNASIEAARAGEHGRGFSVIAQEVRKLADNSSEASTNVGKIIENILAEIQELANESSSGVEATKTGLQEVGQAKQAFGEIQEAVGQLQEHNSDVNTKAFDLTSMSEHLRQLSQPIAENRVIISDGLDAALSLVEQMKEYPEKMSG